MSNLRIGVLGAGIVGLTTAEELTRQYPSADVTIMADKFNVETTSDGAAGLFMLVSKFRGPTEELTRKWVQDSYDYYMELLHKDCGIFEIYGYSLSDSTRDACWCPIMASVLPLYRDATHEELIQFPGNWKHGNYSKALIARA
ncbi:D-aspartate oxidase-like, partial [Nilaparvata lugens]